MLAKNSQRSALLALPAAALLALFAAPASAATVMVNGAPTLDANGAGTLDISSYVSLASGQTANFLSGTATFNFTASDLYSFAGTSYQYLGYTTYGFYCGSGCTGTGYNYYYNAVSTYAPNQSSSTVTTGAQSASASSPVNWTYTYINQTNSSCGSACTYYYNNYQNVGHTNGSYSVTIDLDGLGLAALSSDLELSFDIDRSNPSVTFDGMSFQGEYAVVSSSSGAPEPASWAMMIVGFLGAGAVVRRARKPSVAA